MTLHNTLNQYNMKHLIEHDTLKYIQNGITLENFILINNNTIVCNFMAKYLGQLNLEDFLTEKQQ